MTNRRPHPQVRDYTCVTESIYIQTQYAFCSERAVSCTNTFIVSVQLQNAPQPTEGAVTVYVLTVTNSYLVPQTLHPTFT